MAITIDATAVGTSIGTSSSESGGVITLVPRLTAAEGGGNAYINVVAKVSGVNGLQPYFKVTLTGVASAWDWSGTEDKGFFSYDGLTWTQMGTAPDYVTDSGYVRLRHSATFAQDTVWFARDRREGTDQIGAWITTLSGSYPTLIQNVSGGSNFIADTFASETDELSRTIAACPLYAFWLRRGSGGKKQFCMISGVHASEDWATTVYRKCIEYIASQATLEAQIILDCLDILCIPLVNAPGRNGGHYRNAFQAAQDPNRHFSDAPASIQEVTKPRAVIDANFTNAGGHLDWHGSSGTSNPNTHWFGTDGSNHPPKNTSLGTAYDTRISSYGYTSGNNGNELDGTDGYTTAYMWNTYAPAVSMTLEFNNSKVKTDTAATNQGTALAQALYDRVVAGDFGTYSSNTPYGSFLLKRGG